MRIIEFIYVVEFQNLSLMFKTLRVIIKIKINNPPNFRNNFVV